MPKKGETVRKRMVVEEVSKEATPEVNQEPVAEIKQKVGELQGITEHISDDVDKSAVIVEKIKEDADKVLPADNPVVPTPIPPLETPDKSQYQTVSGPSPMTIILPGILLLGALLGGIFFYQNNVSKNSAEVSTSSDIPAITTEETPAPTPTPAVDLTKYKISVLNGGGVPGEAGKAKTLLEEAGFTVSSAGNAKDYSFTKTIIGAKSAVDKAFLDSLATALGKTYVVGTNETLATSSADLAVVTIGSSKK